MDVSVLTRCCRGATRGIGRAIALHLASRGASILGTYSSPQSAHHLDSLDHTVKNLYASNQQGAQRPKFHGVAADLLSPKCAETIITELERHFSGKLDILVLNAALIEQTIVGQTETEHVQRMLKANVETPVVLVEGLVKENIFNPYSRIITISSSLSRDYHKGMYVCSSTKLSVLRQTSTALTIPRLMYATCKAAIESLTRAWAHELGKRPGMQGTTVNAVLVGLTGTDGFNRTPDERKRRAIAREAAAALVAERIAYPEDIADVVGLLASEASRWISGSVISANGGAVKVL